MSTDPATREFVLQIAADFEKRASMLVKDYAGKHRRKTETEKATVTAKAWTWRLAAELLRGRVKE